MGLLSTIAGAAGGLFGGPGGATLGSLIGTGLEVGGGMMNNAASAKAAKDQMKFQEKMSSTAHQREVKDLRAAGLNPILSATGGNGASSPSGAMPNLQNAAKGVGEAARRMTLIKAELDNLKEDTGVKRTTQESNTESAKLMREQTRTAIKQQGLLEAQTLQAEHSARGVEQENIIRDMDIELYNKTPGGRAYKQYGPAGLILEAAESFGIQPSKVLEMPISELRKRAPAIWAQIKKEAGPIQDKASMLIGDFIDKIRGK